MAGTGRAECWLPTRQGCVLAAVNAAGEDGVPVSRLIVATGFNAKQVCETVDHLKRLRLLRATSARPVRYRITTEGRAKVAVWHALRADGQEGQP